MSLCRRTSKRLGCLRVLFHISKQRKGASIRKHKTIQPCILRASPWIIHSSAKQHLLARFHTIDIYSCDNTRTRSTFLNATSAGRQANLCWPTAVQTGLWQNSPYLHNCRTSWLRLGWQNPRPTAGTTIISSTSNMKIKESLIQAVGPSQKSSV